MNKRFQITIMLVCSVLISSGFLIAFSQPVGNPVVVMFGNSQEENAAVSILEDQFSNAIVVPFASLEYYSLKSRCIGPMIFVGHGVDNGLVFRDSIISDASMLSQVKTCTASQIYLLACNSDSIATQDDSGRTVGFSHAIDAELAALEIALRINIAYGIFEAMAGILDEFFTLVEGKMTGNDPILPLSLSSAEMYNCAFIFVVGMAFAIAGAGISAAAGKLGSAIASRVGSMSLTSGILGQLATFLTRVAQAGIGSVTYYAQVVFGGLTNMASAWLGTTTAAINDWINSMDLFEWFFLLTLVSLEIVLIICTATAYAWIRAAAGIGIAATNAGVIAISDYYDSNSYPCQSILEAISQLI